MNEVIMSSEEIDRVHQRIDDLDKSVRLANAQLGKQLNDIHTDVKVMAKTCEERGVACGQRFSTVNKELVSLESTVKGNGKEGHETRLTKLEGKSDSKERYLFLIIGALISAAFALGLAFIKHEFF